ncbi:GP46-like surface antigen, putative, partial [Bodo saltans]
VCTFAGVTCSSGDVTGIELAGSRLSGTLPERLGELHQMTHFNISGNQVTGTLPRALSNWTMLVQFVIFNNQFSGTLPPAYRTWAAITTFYVAFNQFTGQLPIEYADWGQGDGLPTGPTGLGRYLWVNSNRLNGTLPPEYSSWADSVAHFDAGDNHIVGSIPAQWKSWSRIVFFSVLNNNLTGTLPPELSNWTWMSAFKVGGNRFVGTLPREYAAWGSTVRYFWTDRNHLNGTLPAEYKAWLIVSELNLDENEFHGTIPVEYSAMGSIPAQWKSWSRVLFFSVLNNNLTGTLPPELSNWTLMSDFKVGGNQFVGTLPREYAAWGLSVRYFWTDRNHLNGTLPAEYKAWSIANELNLDENEFHGTIPVEYSAMTLLASFVANDNQLSGTLPDVFGSAWKLVRLLAYNNKFTGTIPETFSQWTQLTSLRLSNNSFSGTLSPTFKTWSQILVFEVAYNRLEGQLPGEYSEWSLITTVSLNNNLLSGTLPERLGPGWQNILTLTAHNNTFLSGTLPTSFSLWAKVYNVYAGNNALSGSLPDSWASGMRSLLVLFLDNNKLSGTISTAFTAFSSLQVLNVAFNNLTGQLPSVVKWPGIYLVGLQGNTHLSGSIPLSWGVQGVFSPFIKIFSVCDTQLCGNASDLNFPLGFRCFTQEIVLGDITSNPFALLGLINDASFPEMSYSCPVPPPPTTPALPSPPPIVNVFDGTVKASIGTARAVSVYSSIVLTFVASPGVQTGMKMSLLQGALTASQLSRLCIIQSDDSDDDVTLTSFVDAANNPLGLDIYVGIDNDDASSLAAGSLVGNTAFVVGFGALLEVFSRVKKFIDVSHVAMAKNFGRVARTLGWTKRSSSNSHDEVTLLPATAATSYFMFLQPTVMNAIVLFGIGGGAALGISISIFTLWVGTGVWVVWTLRTVLVVTTPNIIVLFKIFPPPLSSDTKRRFLSPAAVSSTGTRRLSEAIKYIGTPLGEWVVPTDKKVAPTDKKVVPTDKKVAPTDKKVVPQPQRRASQRFYSRFSEFFTPYAKHHTWFGVVDVLVIGLSGAAQGIAVALTTRDPAHYACPSFYASTCVIMILAIAQMIACVVVQPLCLKLDIVILSIFGSVALLSEVLSLAEEPDAADVTATVGFFLQTVIALTIPFLTSHGEGTTINKLLVEDDAAPIPRNQLDNGDLSGRRHAPREVRRITTPCLNEPKSHTAVQQITGTQLGNLVKLLSMVAASKRGGKN